MLRILRAAGLAVTAVIGSCASPTQQVRHVHIEATLRHEERAIAAAPAALHARLTERFSLADVLAVVHADNPGLHAARSRVRAALAEARVAGRLPDLVAKAELWGAPLLQPYAIDRADAVMLGVRQEFPLASFAPSKRAAATAMANLERVDLIGRARELARDVADAFIAYHHARQERALHIEHIALTQQSIEVVRAAQVAGRASEADVATALVVLSKAQGELSLIDADEAAARAALNAWMARPIDAILGEPAAVSTAAPVNESATQNNHAVLRSSAQAMHSEATAKVVQDEAKLPVLMAGIDYWLMPTAADPHGYGAMVQVSLPWLNHARDADVDVARRRAEAAQSELRSTTLAVDRALAEARARLAAARTGLRIVATEQIPNAEHAVAASKNAFISGAADARSLLMANELLLEARMRQVHLRRDEALARIAVAQITGTEEFAHGT